MWICGTHPWLGGWMMGHSLWGLLILVILATLVWKGLRNRRDGNSAADRSDSLEILKLRLARGEITIEEYTNLKSIL
jgi:putative membrane protein